MIKIFGYSLNRNYDPEGKCVKCPNCASVDFKEYVLDRIDGYMTQPCETEIRCAKCHEQVNYWAYGSFDPCFMFQDKSLPALFQRVIYKLKGWTTP